MATLQQVELGVLGPVQVRQYGLPVAIPGAKPRAILTMLGLHSGSVVAADALIELLWGDAPPRTAVKAMQTHISALRRALGDGVVLTEGAGWILSTADVDATRYKTAARLGRDAIATGDASLALTHFDEALALWRGGPELPDGRRGVSEKTRWVEGHAALVEDRADALLATGRAAEIIGELEAAIADCPLRERRWGHLMLALYRAGRQAEALGAYQRVRSLLSEELGVDPGPDLRRLEAAIVSQDVALELPASHHVSAVTRAITFLLTDIEGSTAAWEANADAMAASLARHDEIVEQVVTFRGGRLIKTRGEGDATFSVFDRPSGAAAAAIELQEAIQREPWPLAVPMRIRVALHTGEVEFRDGDYFGRAVNRAARLRSLAGGGQILCSGATAELVIDSLADDAVLTDLGMRQLKNLARPEHVFELHIEAEDFRTRAVDSPVAQPALPAVLAGSGPFVGRGRELERLVATWQTVQVAGSHAVLISGEPGVGKTRLAGEWSRQAYEQGAVVLYGRCDEDLGAPYQPFSEAMRSLVPSLGSNRLRGIRGVEALIPLVPELTEVLPELAAPPRADPDTERYALFDAVGALLGITAASASVVLVLDDLHWAAKPTLLLLRHLLRFGEHASVQIVGTYRSTDLDRSHPLAAMLADLHRDGSVSRLPLGGLDEDDVTAYVAEAGYDDEELARALSSVTGGNPFFLIEALRHVDESGGRWDPTTLPQGVREAISRRLSRLPEETNAALATAAVVGSRFELALVERVVGHDLVDAFDESAKAGIVIEEPSGRYRFNHAIVRQSLLAELASVRRMRLHQRIASTLESEAGADDELLAELAYHYFECAWAGNAAKAVEYCRRAGDQAMARLAYEGAADLYDKAVHALEDLDHELPGHAEQRAELLVARCEALLAAGDVVAAKGAVSQLQATATHSGRLAAWGACFDGQLSMLTDPERLDEIEAAVMAAAESLAKFNDAAGEAKAHTVRAGCLARLGRIGDAEAALDQALTAARQARDHRRVNAVLANAPLAALWGPNPVPRAGGRCLDVVRLLRITTGSPVVEATSTRCQGVLDSFRGRAAAGRQLIESARRSLTELGMRHSLLELDQFAGIVELVSDNPAAAEPLLRRAYNGFRRMRLDADTAETAALLARVYLALDRIAEADQLCSESEQLAGHAFKAAIAWRTIRARLLARGGDHNRARMIAEEAVTIAERTDLLVDHGDACLTLAMVLKAAGNAAGAQLAAEKAVSLYELKGAVALAEKARNVIGSEAPMVRVRPGTPATQPDNECMRLIRELGEALPSEDWDRIHRFYSPDVSFESRRKIVGFSQQDLPSGDWPREAKRLLEVGGAHRLEAIEVRGERLALARLELGTGDASPGAPCDESIQLFALDERGRLALQLSFDVEDLDEAIAELDVLQTRFAQEDPSVPTIETENSCVRTVRRMESAWRDEAWSESESLVAPNIHVENRRKIVGITRGDLSSAEWINEARRFREPGMVRHRSSLVAIRGERLTLTRVQVSTEDETSGSPQDEMLILYGVDASGRIALQVTFDADDIDTAIAELDAQHGRIETPHARIALENAASFADDRLNTAFTDRRWHEIEELLADDVRLQDRRRGLRNESTGRAAVVSALRAIADVGTTSLTPAVLAIRGNYLALVHTLHQGRDTRPDAFHTETLTITEVSTDGLIVDLVALDVDDFEAALAHLDARYAAGEAAQYAHAWSLVTANVETFNRHDFPAWTADVANIDHRRVTAFAPGDQAAYVRATWEQSPDLKVYVEAVHRLSDLGAVFTYLARGTSREDFEAEWRGISVATFDGDEANHAERFDDADLDAALARFDELSRPQSLLENAASRVYDRLWNRFEAGDWRSVADQFTEEVANDDRRRVINAGIEYGCDTQLENLRRLADIGATVSWRVIATRGDRLILNRIRTANSDLRLGEFDSEMLNIIETDVDDRILAGVLFDVDDIDAAYTELDFRYLAGEADPHAPIWSAITSAYAGLMKGAVPPMTADVVNIDHRPVTPMEPDEGIAYLHASWDIANGFDLRIEAVHRLSHLGAVFTRSSYATSKVGFAAEWRAIDLITIEGDRISRGEIFDEAELDIALARFDELDRPATQLGNMASRVLDRFLASFAAQDWPAMAEMLARDHYSDDRRPVIGAGISHGREAQIEDLRGMGAESWALAPAVIATRGERLLLYHGSVSGHDQQAEALEWDLLVLIEIDADERIAAWLVFDPEDIDAAVGELEARYLAGEAAPHAHAWSAIVNASNSFNRREMFLTTPDWVNVDHRRVTAFEAGEQAAYVHATFDIAPNINHRIVAVHRLTGLGAVITQTESVTSREQFEAEWHEIALLTIEGDAISRCEVFDETDLEAAIARFDEISAPALHLENPATRQGLHIAEAFNRRDLNGFLGSVTATARCDDRRRGLRNESAVNAEFVQGILSVSANNWRLTIEPMALRGHHLALSRYTYRDTGEADRSIAIEVLVITEVTDDGLADRSVVFDTADLDAAFAELDARYLSGEAAEYAGTWSVITRSFVAFNNHEPPPTAFEFIDRRRLVGSGPGDLTDTTRAAWDMTRSIRACVEAVHKLVDGGAVITQSLRGTSLEGFDFEWRVVDVFTVDGDAVTRCEMFDEADLEIALARFAELNRSV